MSLPSCAVSKRLSGTVGPKVYSLLCSMSIVTEASTVGS
jgi:hypothetical protein